MPQVAVADKTTTEKKEKRQFAFGL